MHIIYSLSALTDSKFHILILILISHLFAVIRRVGLLLLDDAPIPVNWGSTPIMFNIRCFWQWAIKQGRHFITVWGAVTWFLEVMRIYAVCAVRVSEIRTTVTQRVYYRRKWITSMTACKHYAFEEFISLNNYNPD